LVVLGIVYFSGIAPIPALILVVVVSSLIYAATGAANFKFSKTQSQPEPKSP